MSAFVRADPAIYVFTVADLLIKVIKGHSSVIAQTMVTDGHCQGRMMIGVHDIDNVRGARGTRCYDTHLVKLTSELNSHLSTLYRTVISRRIHKFQRLPPSPELTKVLDLLRELISASVYWPYTV